MNVTFFMEQHIGHRSYFENLRRYVEQIGTLNAQWVEITYRDGNSWWQHVPILPESIRGGLAGRRQVLRGLQAYPSDVTFFFTQVPAALGGKAVGMQPYVLTTDITPVQYDAVGEQYDHKTDRLPLIRSMKHRANLQLFNRAARIIPWSNWVRDSLIDDYGVPTERMEVVYPGVDLDFWQPGERPKGARPVRILFVGGDFIRKGGPLLLEAFQALPPGEAELVLVTREKIPAQNGVEVHNGLRTNSAELLAVFQSCDIFVLPSEAEAFGIAAIEASAAGLPVIATTIGGLQGIVKDGQTGFLMAAGDVEALVHYLQRLLSDPQLRRQMGLAARRRAEACFDARRCAQRIIEILGAVASESR